jgi:flagellar FliL protein
MSAKQEVAEAAPSAAPAKSKKKPILIGAIVGVLVLGGAGAGAMLLLGNSDETPAAGEHAVASEGNHEAAVPREAIYIDLEPAFVVNFQDTKGRTKFLKAGINVVTRDLPTSEALGKHMPAIRNGLVMLLSKQIFEDLLPQEGKEKLRGEVLAEVRNALTRELPAATIEDVLFTSFVMQ